jgi:predicted regulator of Ras-like GTPase activity (Roadblock/LC7/MglB family)
MIRNKAQVQDYLLGKLKKSSTDILEAAIVSNDGLVLVSTATDESFREKVSALAASIFRPAQKAANDLVFDGLNFVVVSGKQRNMYLKEVINSQLLAVLVKSEADWGKVQKEINKAVEDLQYIAGIKEKF